jgi:hypothetical protein
MAGTIVGAADKGCDGGQRSVGAVVRDRRLLQPEVTENEVNAILLASTPSIGFYAAAIAASALT